MRTDIAHPCRRCDPQGLLTLELIIEGGDQDSFQNNSPHTRFSGWRFLFSIISSSLARVGKLRKSIPVVHCLTKLTVIAVVVTVLVWLEQYYSH